jgi:hypothetical protein
MRTFNKLFVTSLPRCATVSICHALAHMGIPLSHLGKTYQPTDEALKWSSSHHDPQRFIELYQRLERGDYEPTCLQDSRGMADYPACCPTRLERFAQRFPNSLFLHVARDADVHKWLQSTERQLVGLDLLDAEQTDPTGRRFMQVMRSFRRETFGTSSFDAKLFERAYTEHQRWIQGLASSAPEQWLVFSDISELVSEGFRKLATFLDVPAPNLPFPHAEEHSRRASRAFYAALRKGIISSQTGINASE